VRAEPDACGGRTGLVTGAPGAVQSPRREWTPHRSSGSFPDGRPLGRGGNSGSW